MQVAAPFSIIITIFTVFVAPLCNARRDYFSGSHSVYEDPLPGDASSRDLYYSHSQQQLSLQEQVRNRSLGEENDVIDASFVLHCPSKDAEVKAWGIQLQQWQSCGVPCKQDIDCNNEYKCFCDGACGLTCNSIDIELNFCLVPEPIEHGKIFLLHNNSEEVIVDHRNVIKRFSHNQKILFECEQGYDLVDGTAEKTCRVGDWLPVTKDFRCVRSANSTHRLQKRRAHKTGGGIIVKGGNRFPGGSSDRGVLPRRPSSRKQTKHHGEENEIVLGVMACPELDHDEYMFVEVIKNGEDVNNTYSEGALAKVSCTPGFGINLFNETVICERGRWRPKLPQCSALPCRVPYVERGSFYIGNKPLYFEELKTHEMKIELRCGKGYMPRGTSRLKCYYGEWDLNEAPECIPAACKLPALGKGIYLEKYKADMLVASGTNVNYICDENYQKPYSSGSAKCDHGEWNPIGPMCISTELFMHRNFSLESNPAEKGCGSPPQEKLAVAYFEGIPLDFKAKRRFSHGVEVMYRCVIIKPRTKNRWKLICNNGEWNKVSSTYKITCDPNVTVSDVQVPHEVTQVINSNCTYEKTDKNVVTFHSGHEILEEEVDYPTGTVLVSRCVDIGKFQMSGAPHRKCLSGQWMGITPKCDGLNQIYDYATDKRPTILFRFVNGSIAQTLDSKLIVYPGTTLHMECIYLRKFGKPTWEVSHKNRVYPEGWTDGIEGRDPTLEYRLTIDNATDKDNGIYSCSTPTRHPHQIHVIVKKVDCQPLPIREDLIYSTNSTKAGTRVAFSCKENNSLVGNKDIQCQASAMWNGGLPRCENIECPDISIVPAMAPLANISRNVTLQRNETAPPKVTIKGRGVGGKAVFTCPQGFLVEGEVESVCQSNGEWSNAMPLCKEVECENPPAPENGNVKGSPPYKAGDIAQIGCNGGFMMEGQHIIVCQDSGKWSRPSSTTKCVQACTYPGTIIGGKISEVKFLYGIGEKIEFSCVDSYQLVGDSVLRCLPPAKWSHNVPECVQQKRSRG